MYNKFIAIIFKSIFFLLCYNSAFAEDIVIGVETSNFYQIYHVDANGAYVGFFRDVLDDFCKKNKYNCVFKTYPIKRLFEEYLNSNNIDVKCPDNSLWNSDAKKSKTINYSTKLIKYTEGFMVFTSRLSKKTYTILAPSGFTIPKEPRVKIKTTPNSDSGALLQICSKDADCDGIYSNVYLTTQAAAEPAQANITEKTTLNSDLASTNDGYSCSSIKRKDFIDKLNTYLEGAGSNKFIQDLKIKYSLQTQ